MRKLIFIIIFILSIGLNALEIDKSGRIIKPGIDAIKYFQSGEYYIDYQGHTFIGTSLHPIKNGFLTLITLEESAPVWLRIYDQSGNLIIKQQYNKVINLTSSEDLCYTTFFDGNEVIIYDSKNQMFDSQQGSTLFSVNNSGEIAYVDRSNRLKVNGQTYNADGLIRGLKYYQNKLYVISDKGFYTFDNKLKEICQGSCLEMKIVDEQLYVVIKEQESQENHVSIYKLTKRETMELIAQKKQPIMERTHEDISSPLKYSEENYEHPIGNSYGEIQQYGDTAYLHPGVDFLGDDYEEVYAVHDGYVKAILTTGGDPYWRIAIANEDSDTEAEGYLYAHLNESSFTVAVGDFVQAGQLIGTLYPWDYYDFTHVHYARIKSSGFTWQGDWWTVDNPQVDTTNLIDSTAPVFNQITTNQMFAFRDESGNYLDSQHLNGSFDILVDCYDQTNSDWKIDIWEIDFEITKADEPEIPLYFKFSFAYDFSLDTYGESSWDAMILNTIYSRDEQYFSLGNYEERTYFHLITNNDNNADIDVTDAANIFDSTQFSDGNYLLTVTARDASGNSSSEIMEIYFENGISSVDADYEQTFSNCFPNPCSITNDSGTQISFQKKTDSIAKVEIYNLKGQLVRILSTEECGVVNLIWNGKNKQDQQVSDGIYFYKISVDQKLSYGKIALFK